MILDRIAIRRFLWSQNEARGLFLRPLKMHRAILAVEDMAMERMAPDALERQMSVAGIGATGTFVEELFAFLREIWPDLLKLILELLG